MRGDFAAGTEEGGERCGTQHTFGDGGYEAVGYFFGPHVFVTLHGMVRKGGIEHVCERTACRTSWYRARVSAVYKCRI